MVWKDSHLVFGQEFKQEQREEMIHFGGETFRPIPRFCLYSVHIFSQYPYGVSVVMLFFALLVHSSMDVETISMLPSFEKKIHFFSSAWTSVAFFSGS
jgi:hypothetical protein